MLHTITKRGMNKTIYKEAYKILESIRKHAIDCIYADYNSNITKDDLTYLEDMYNIINKLAVKHLGYSKHGMNQGKFALDEMIQVIQIDLIESVLDTTKDFNDEFLRTMEYYAIKKWYKKHKNIITTTIGMLSLIGMMALCGALELWV